MNSGSNVSMMTLSTSPIQALASSTHHHVSPRLHRAQLPRRKTAKYSTQPLVRAQRIDRRRGKSMDLSAELRENGFVRSGELQSQSIAALRDAESLTIRGRTGRQTELEWNSDCEAVITDFEEVSDLRALLLWTCLF